MTTTAIAPRLQEIADRVYAYIQPHGGWCVSNAGVLVGRKAVTLVDTAATESRNLALRTAVAGLTSAPPRTVINTHHHGDHTNGNGLFTGGADGAAGAIVAHDLAREAMAVTGTALQRMWPGTDWGNITVTLPTLTFPDRLTLYVDDLTVELIHVGPAHTTNDIVAWLPGPRVLFAGDVLLPGCTPYVLQGSLSGALHAVGRLRALEPVTVVGGHGRVSGLEVLDATEKYLLWVRELAREGLRAGLEPLETARESGPGPFAQLLDPERLVANLHRAYAEERGRPPGAYISSTAVFEEMVELNGGRPLDCRA